MVEIITANPTNAERLLKHVESQTVNDFIIKLINVEDISEGKGTMDVSKINYSGC